MSLQILQEVEMSFQRWGYTVEGCWTDPNNIEARSGVYIIWCGDDSPSKVIDVGEAHDVSNRVLDHDRSDCWKRYCQNKIWYSAIYTPNQQQAGRKIIEQKIRQQENPPCGER